MIEQMVNTIIRWRWLVIAFTLVWVGVAASGMRHLSFTTDYRVFFSADNPQLVDFEALQNTYDKSDNILFVISPKDGDVFSPKTLESIAWLTEQVWQTPYSIRVDSVTNFQHSRAEGDALIVESLLNENQELSPQRLETLRSIALNEPILYKRLINAEASVTGVNVTVQLPGQSMTEVPEAANFARTLAAQLRQRDSNLEVRLSGMVMFNNAFGENAKNDMGKLVPLMFLVIIIGLGFLLRSISATVATVFVIMMSIVVGMGLFGWSGYKISPPSASAPNIILTMAVADSVHFLLTFLLLLRGGTAKNQAIVESMQLNGKPLLITTVTTVLGFLALNFSEVPPLVHLGNVVAVGVSAAYLLTVTLMPALISLLPIRVPHNSANSQPPLAGLSRWVIDHSRALLWGSVLLSLLWLSQIPRNEINDDFVKYFDTSTEFRQDTDYAIEHLIGPNRIEYSLESGSEGGVTDIDFLTDVQRFVEYADSQPEVVHVSSVLDTLKRLNRNMHGDQQDWYRLPDSQELAAQYLLLYEMSLPYGLDLNNQINVKKSSTRVVLTFDSTTTSQMLALEQRFAQWLSEETPALEFKAASSNLMFSHIGQRNTRSMLSGAALALGMISFILVLVFRSLKLGTLSLIPNLLPVGIAFGIWGLMVGQVGLSLAPVVGMTLGIVVDDTVYFLSHYHHARRNLGLSAERGIHAAFAHVGPAMLITTLVLVAGFLILALSVFKLNSDMGLLTATTIAIALIVDFFLLPALLLRFDANKATANTN